MRPTSTGIGRQGDDGIKTVLFTNVVLLLKIEWEQVSLLATTHCPQQSVSIGLSSGPLLTRTSFFPVASPYRRAVVRNPNDGAKNCKRIPTIPHHNNIATMDISLETVSVSIVGLFGLNLAFKAVSHLYKTFLRPAKDLTKLGKWAVVTGATGKGMVLSIVWVVKVTCQLGMMNSVHLIFLSISLSIKMVSARRMHFLWPSKV